MLDMNLKLALIATVTVASLATAFAQSMQLKGTVTGLNKDQITLQSGDGTWIIKRTPKTEHTGGALVVGGKVTLQCDRADAHKANGSAAAPAPSKAPHK